MGVVSMLSREQQNNTGHLLLLLEAFYCHFQPYTADKVQGVTLGLGRFLD